MRLANSEYFYFLLIIPVMIILFLLLQRWRKKNLYLYADRILHAALLRNASVYKPILRFTLLMIALLFFITGLVNPQIGTKLEKVKRKGIDLMICLDVSQSMLAEDFKPNRLEKSKRAIARLIDQLQGDRIGLIVFAGKSYVQLPITTDYAAAKLFLSTVSTDMVPTQGTDIGSAIELSMQSFGDSTFKHNAIIVITDGEDHEGTATAAALEASKKGAYVHTIGMGTDQGAPIPVLSNNRKVGYKQDSNGTTIISKLNDESLYTIAQNGKGKYIKASNNDDGLELIISEIEKMETNEFESKIFTSYDDQFQIFLGIAFIILFLEIFISNRKSKWIHALNPFRNV